MDVADDHFDFNTSIDEAIAEAKQETESLQETVSSLQALKPNCDKLDYALAASSGVLTGLIDAFFVGKPGESKLGNVVDDWFAKSIVLFARLYGWEGGGRDPFVSALVYLQNKFRVPYDQTCTNNEMCQFFKITAKDHHFKSLGHNPTLLGLFFSLWDQFHGQSDFVSEGARITLHDVGDGYELSGHDFLAKLFSGFINWFGHLLSDVAGSSGSTQRGMGIPSQFWAWTNDIIAIKGHWNIAGNTFEKRLNDFAFHLFKDEGLDYRFQTTQTIPVRLNGLLVKFFYTFRRTIKFLASDDGSFKNALSNLFSSRHTVTPELTRMLTVAHGTFCVMDLGDAAIRSTRLESGFDGTEFFLRLNIPGLNQFRISLWGEAKQNATVRKAKPVVETASKESALVNDYLNALTELSTKYNDKNLVNFVNDFKRSGAYVTGFEKSAQLATLRGVPDKKVLENKADIDAFFKGRKL